jgi:hypothetical protein
MYGLRCMFTGASVNWRMNGQICLAVDLMEAVCGCAHWFRSYYFVELQCGPHDCLQIYAYPRAVSLVFQGAGSLLYASCDLDTTPFDGQYVFLAPNRLLPMHHVDHLAVLKGNPFLVSSTQTTFYDRSFRIAGCRCVGMRATAASEFEYALEERTKGGDASYYHTDTVLGVTPEDHLRYTICWRC